jgi:hypothetical protein
MHKVGSSQERRRKRRFAMQRELRFKVLSDDRVITTGGAQTINISSGGVAFESTTPLPASLVPGTLLELSISWPILLDATCLMRLVVFGHVVRTRQRLVVCNIERYEFRTQARTFSSQSPAPAEGAYRRWIGAPVREAKAAAGA